MDKEEKQNLKDLIIMNSLASITTFLRNPVWCSTSKTKYSICQRLTGKETALKVVLFSHLHFRVHYCAVDKTVSLLMSIW